MAVPAIIPGEKTSLLTLVSAYTTGSTVEIQIKNADASFTSRRINLASLENNTSWAGITGENPRENAALDAILGQVFALISQNNGAFLPYANADSQTTMLAGPVSGQTAMAIYRQDTGSLFIFSGGNRTDATRYLEIKPPTVSGSTDVDIVGRANGQILSWNTALGKYTHVSPSPGAAVTWDSLPGKPATFPPAAHGHPIADITGLTVALNGKQNLLTAGANISIIGGTISSSAGGAAIASTAEFNAGNNLKAVSAEQIRDLSDNVVLVTITTPADAPGLPVTTGRAIHRVFANWVVDQLKAARTGITGVVRTISVNGATALVPNAAGLLAITTPANARTKTTVDIGSGTIIDLTAAAGFDIIEIISTNTPRAITGITGGIMEKRYEFRAMSAELSFFDNSTFEMEAKQNASIDPILAGYAEFAHRANDVWYQTDAGFYGDVTPIPAIKSATVNGGTLILPDGAGNLALVVAASGSVDQTVIDGSTNPVSGNAVFDRLTAKQDVLTAGSNITIIGGVIASSGGGGAGITDGDKGDITVSGTGATWTIDNDAVTFAKFQNVNPGILLGRSAGTVGDVQQVTIGANLTLDAATNTLSGTAAAAGGITNINGLTGSTVSLDASEILLEGFTLSTTAIAPGIDLQIAFGRLQGNINARFTLPTGGLATEYLNGLGQRAAFAEVTVSGAFTLSAAGVATLGTGVVASVNISQMGAATGQALVWNGTAWVPTTVAAGGSSSLSQYLVGVGSASNQLSGSAALVFFQGRLSLSGSTQTTKTQTHLQNFTVGATDYLYLGANYYFDSAINVKDNANFTAANIYVINSATNLNAELGIDLFPKGALATMPVLRSKFNAEAASYTQNRFYGSLGLGIESPAKGMLAITDSAKATPTSVNIQMFSFDANLDQGFIGWNKYWNGSARVRQNTSLTGTHFTSNVGVADATAVFGAVFTTVAGVEKNIFYGYMDAAANVYFTIPAGVRFGLGAEAVSNELYTVRGTDTSGLAQLRYGLSAIVTYNPESAVGAGYEARALAGDSRKDGAFSAYNITGLLGVARQNGTGAVTVLMGANLIADVLTSSPGAVTHMAGARVGITCQAAGGTATVTNGYGLYVNAPIQLAAQAFSGTNLYGIYIQDQRGVSDLPYLATGEVKPGGAWVNRYAIFSAGGKVNLSNLPTSSAGLSTGDLWNNGGTISIV